MFELWVFRAHEGWARGRVAGPRCRILPLGALVRAGVGVVAASELRLWEVGFRV